MPKHESHETEPIVDSNSEIIDEIIRLDDRIDIFRHLTIDEVNSTVNHEIFEGLLSKYYEEFVKFCEELEQLDSKRVKGVSCHIADNQIYFDVEYIR